MPHRVVAAALVAAALVAAAAVTGSGPLAAQTTVLTSVADTYLKSGSPNRNQGDETILRVRSSGHNRALIRFDPAAIGSSVGSGRLAAARLELLVADNGGNWGSEGRTVDVHRMTESWAESSATWNCGIDADPSNGSPDCSELWDGARFEEEPSDSLVFTGETTGWVSFDVTADLTAFLAGGEHHGWLVKKTEEGQNGRVDFASRDAGGGDAPRLVLVVESVEHDEVAPKLAITSPDAAVLVGESMPTVAVEYRDGGTGVDLATLEVFLDGADLTPACTAGTGSASCVPESLAAGLHTVEARLRDLAGNLATASFTFELLSGPGLHIVRIPLDADTYLRQGAPNQNQGSESLLRVKQSGKNRALLAVDTVEVASLLAGTTVRSAWLELFIEQNGNNWGSQGRTVDLHLLTAPWAEEGATWSCTEDADTANQQPDCDPQWDGGSYQPDPVETLLIVNGLAGPVELDVTPDVMAMAGGAAHHGWLLKKTAEGQSGRVELTSRQGVAGHVPAVVVVLEIDGGGPTDATPPEITDLTPADATLTNAPRPQISASFADSHSGIDVGRVRFFLDGVERTDAVSADATGFSFLPDSDLADGAHLLVASVWDLAANVAQAAWSFTVDTTAPALTLSSPRPGQLTNHPQVRISGDVTDASGVASLTVAGVPVPVHVAGGTFAATAVLLEGTNLIEVAATDLAGNAAAVAREVQRFTLPEVAIAQPTDLSVVPATAVDVMGSVSEGTVGVAVNGVEAELDGSSFTALDVPLVEGGNVLTASATDSLGRLATDSVTVVRDLVPPTVAIYAPSDGAALYEPTVTVRGLVNDIVAGTVNASEATVAVNGLPAQVVNRSFLVTGVPLDSGLNLIEVVAMDEAGNTAAASVQVERTEPQGGRITVVSGNHQSAAIGTALQAPLVAELLDAAGLPVEGRPILFKLVGSNGALNGVSRHLAVPTGPDGRAQVAFTLGTRAGVGNQVVQASAVGFGPPAELVATALPSEPALIVVDAGGQQVGVAGRDLPRPLVAAVTDAGFNRLAGVPVRFEVVKGQGSLPGGAGELVVATDSDGRAIVPFTLDPEEGIAGNVVEAAIEGLDGGPVASFVATGWAAGMPQETSISGVVLDNSNLPIPGVTMRVRDSALMAETDAQGVFRIEGAPVGTVYLIADGSTAARPGAWPDLEFVVTTVPGRDNDVGMPIFLLPLDLGSGLFVDETQGGTLTLDAVPGFALEIAPGSVTFPGGSKSGVVSVTAVHSDKVPMVPNFGQQPRFIVTIQPAGARFDPPARMTLPNVEGLAPGEVSELYSFDHDLGHFVSIGPATVSEDGATIVSDPGVGVFKAGWQCGGNPAAAGTGHACPDCQSCVGNRCVRDPDGASCSDDGDLCTTDVCAGGACTHAPKKCDECKKCEGGNCVADPGQDGDSCGSLPGMICKDGDCVCPVPENFHQVGSGVDFGGTLQFRYEWDSSTGDLSDLTACSVFEQVVYPSQIGPFTWPMPWSGNTPSPTVVELPATLGFFMDDHSSLPISPPYQAASFTAQQRYIYVCPCADNGDPVVMAGIHPITRSITLNPNGTWKYEITKTGASATVNPLP